MEDSTCKPRGLLKLHHMLLLEHSVGQSKSQVQTKSRTLLNGRVGKVMLQRDTQAGMEGTCGQFLHLCCRHSGFWRIDTRTVPLGGLFSPSGLAL